MIHTHVENLFCTNVIYRTVSAISVPIPPVRHALVITVELKYLNCRHYNVRIGGIGDDNVTFYMGIHQLICKNIRWGSISIPGIVEILNRYFRWGNISIPGTREVLCRSFGWDSISIPGMVEILCRYFHWGSISIPGLEELLCRSFRWGSFYGGTFMQKFPLR